MYAIRVDDQQKLLRVDLVGRIHTHETLRAISQASVLAEASDIRAVLCDATGLERGPASLMVIAAALNAAHRPGMRIALVGTPAQARIAQRLARFSGLRTALATFSATPDAEAWLVPPLLGSGSRGTAREEAEQLLGRPLLVERTRRMSTQAPPAA